MDVVEPVQRQRCAEWSEQCSFAHTRGYGDSKYRKRERGKKKQRFYTTESSRALRDPITTVGCVALCVCLRARMRVYCGNTNSCMHGDKMGDFPLRKSLNC